VRRHRRNATIGLGVLVALAMAPGAIAAGGKTPLVVAKAPLGQTVQDLLKGKFVEKVTCSRACTMTTSVVIRPRMARRLGFTKVVDGQWVEIGSAKRVLSAKTPTKVTIRLNAQAKRRLVKANSGLQVLGRVNATSNRTPRTRGSAGWVVTCSWR